MNNEIITKGWKKIKLKEVLTEISERNKGERVTIVLSVTNSKGFVNQEEYFEGTIHSTDISKYKIIRKNQFAYNPSRVNVGSIDILQDYEEGVLSPMYVVFEVDTTKLLPEYFKYYFQTNRFYENVKNNTQGSVRYSLSFKALADFWYLLPPIKEQEKIVGILKTIDSIIEKYESLLEEKNQFIKSQFVEMFGNPISNDKNWNIDIMNNVAPSQNYKGSFDEDKVWLLNLDMIESNTGNIIDYIYEDINNIGTSTCTFNEENVLYSKLRPYLNKVVIPNKSGFATSELVPLKPKKDLLNRYFLTYLLRSDEFVQYISEKVAGTKMPRVSMELFRKFEVMLPPLELQQKFEMIVEQIDKQKFLLDRQKQNYQKLKKGLMQQLLTGKIRVKI